MKVINTESNTCLFFLHGGAGMDYSYFLPFFNELEYSQVYYTQGEHCSSVESMDDLVSELNDIIKKYGKENNILIGHSFGGALALEYLKKHEKRVSGSVLISGIHSSKWSQVYTQNHNGISFSLKKEDFNNLNDYYKKECLYYAPEYFSKDFLETGKKVLEEMNYNYELREKILKTYLADFDCKNIISELETPLLSLGFSGDQIVYDEHCREITEINKNVTYKCIDGLSHFPFVENPTLINNEIKEFVRSVYEKES